MDEEEERRRSVEVGREHEGGEGGGEGEEGELVEEMGRVGLSEMA